MERLKTLKKEYLNKKFQLLSDKDESFQVELKFSSPSIVTKIQLRLIKTYRFQLSLLNQKNHLAQQFAQLVLNQEGKVVLYPKNTQPVYFARLKIQNDPFNMKRIGIIYVYFEGFSDESLQNNKRSTNKNKSQSKIQTQDIKLQLNLKNDPKSVHSKDLFNGRLKQKPSVKDDVQRLLGLTLFRVGNNQKQQQKVKLQQIEQKLKKKVKLNENVQNSNKKSTKKQIDLKLQEKQETDLALALSKSQYQQMEIENDFQKMEIQDLKQEEESLPAQLENYLDNILQVPDRRYQTVEFNEDYILMFSDLNPKWLEAQKIAEIQAQVRQQERLSNYVRIKYLIGVEVYISDFPEWKIEQLKHQAKQLGCKIIPQLKNHCLAIVPRSVCQKLRKKHKSWNQIKYLIPQYLEECIKQQSKLSPKDYYLRI